MGASLLMATMSVLQTYPEFLLSLLCFLGLFAYYNIFRRQSLMPIEWPIIGMLPGVILRLQHIHDWGVGIYRQVGCTFWFHGPWFLGMDYLCTADPANVQHIFNVNFDNYPKGKEFAEIFDILGDGIFNSDADSWKKQRIKAHTLVTGRRFRALVADSARAKVERVLLPLLDYFAQRQDAVVDLQDVFLRLTFDTTCYLVFGVDPGCLSVDFPTIPFAKAMDDAMGALLMRHAVPPAWWKLMRWLRVGEERKLAAARKLIDCFIVERIAEKQRRHMNNQDSNEEDADLLSAYINDANDDDAKSIKFLRDTAVNFMLAGRDTTGTALTWFFWLISKNPKEESKILEELKATPKSTSSSGPSLTLFDAEELNKCLYLQAALYESLRLYPSVPFEHKAAVESEVLPSGHKVEAGTKILLSAYCMARLEGIWGKDCMEFRPERWLTEKGRLRHEPSYKFLSFNSGPRTCLGKEVAFTQMKAVAAAVVYNFNVELVEGHVVEPKLSIILHMKNGLRMRVKKRSAESD